MGLFVCAVLHFSSQSHTHRAHFLFPFQKILYPNEFGALGHWGIQGRSRVTRDTRHLSRSKITTRKRSLGQGIVFTHVRLSTQGCLWREKGLHRGRGGGGVGQTLLGLPTEVVGQTHYPSRTLGILQNTVNKGPSNRLSPSPWGCYLIPRGILDPPLGSKIFHALILI